MRAIPLQFEPSRTVVPIGVFVFLISLTVGVNAQDERPDVHADFKYGVFPYSSEAVERFAPEPARLMISAFHKGWNLDKYIRESGNPEVEVLTLLQEFEDDRLVRGRNDNDLRPGFPVYREDELPESAPLIDETAAGFVRTIESQWSGFEELVSSLEAGQNFPREEMLYRVVAGGLLFGGMIDALFDDKTLMPAPPRRAGRREAYYAWMTEGEAGPTQLILQSAPVGRYNVFSIGTVPVDEPRVEIGELSETAPVFEYDDARRWRVFASVTARDHLLPYFKSQRSSLLELGSIFDASNYTAFGEFVAWFYLASATEAVNMLVESGRIEAPETSYRYAILTDR